MKLNKTIKKAECRKKTYARWLARQTELKAQAKAAATAFNPVLKSYYDRTEPLPANGFNRDDSGDPQ